MSDEERNTVRRLLRQARRNMVLAIIACPALIGLALLSYAIFKLDSPMTFILIPLAMFSPVGSILGILDTSRQIRGLVADFREGTVSVFGNKVEGGSEGHQVETLPVSERLWTVAGEYQRKWTIARRGETATRPDYAAMAADWVQPVEGAPPGSPHYNMRDLAAPETDELHRHLRFMRWRNVPIALIVNAWLVISLVTAKQPAGPPRPLYSRPDPYVIGVLFILCNWRLLAQWKRSIPLSRDLTQGRVVIARMPSQREDSVTLSEAVEFLPHSRLYWSIGGKPAGWRLTPMARRRSRRETG